MQEKKTTILGIALLYTAITSIFVLLQKINTAIFANETTRLYWFLRRNSLWIITIAVIAFLNSIKLKESGQKLHSILEENPIIGSATGVLVVLKSISDLANTVPASIISIQSVFDAIKYIDVFLDGTKERMIFKAFLTNSLSIAIILCQIAVGISLMKIFQKRLDRSPNSNIK
jgi:hypothetical protein